MLKALALVALALAVPAWGQAPPGALDQALGSLTGRSGQPLALSLQLLLVMGLLTVLPSLLLMMTSFTRILIVLSILRQAIGLQQTPPNQVLIGLALFLSLFVMSPVLDTANRTAVAPYMAGSMDAGAAVAKGGEPFHAFMVAQTRKSDLLMFTKMAKRAPYAKAADIPWSVLLPAFITSELKTAFQIGFLIFLPFLLVDLLIASVLMALGMMMTSPTIIALPFKLLLFVLVDGWTLTMGSLANSFGS